MAGTYSFGVGSHTGCDGKRSCGAGAAWGCGWFGRCDINSCFAAIAAAFDDPIVYSLAILRDVAKRERDGKGGLTVPGSGRGWIRG